MPVLDAVSYVESVEDVVMDEVSVVASTFASERVSETTPEVIPGAGTGTFSCSEEGK